MARHSYSITINKAPSQRNPIEYKYRSTNCTLTCSAGAASVSYESTVQKSFDDLISFRVDLIKDAMRKMYLLHALRCGSRLKVNRVIVTIDGESMEYGKETPGFPFLHSMLTAKDLALPKSWQEPGFQEAVLKATKSASDNDLRFACLFSFLAGTGKQFESERFTCYWTAINAHYNYLLKCAKQFHADKLHAASYDQLPKKQRFKDSDAIGISALMRYYGCGEHLRPQAERRTPTGPDKDKQENYHPQYGAVKSLLRQIPREDLPDFYRQLYAHRTDYTWIPEGPLGEHLKLCQERCRMSSWGFLLFEYAYYIRCNYLHGNKTTVLFTASNDPEVAAFRALNVFLGEYLKEVIPQMFGEDWFEERMYEAVIKVQPQK